VPCPAENGEKEDFDMKIVQCVAALLFVFSVVVLPDGAFPADLLIVEAQATEPYSTLRQEVLRELASLGFAAGKNLTVKQYSIGNAEGRARRIWQEEKDNRYDVIFISGTVAAIQFKEFAYADPHYKFIFGAVTDPVGVGIIKDFENPPAANFTGVAYPVKVEKRLQFIREVMPMAKNIGFIYADMPQSHSYIKWLREALQSDTFNGLTFHFRPVTFVHGERGHMRMALLAKEHVKELDAQVDLFLSPNDQMGVQESFARIVVETATKPLVGLGRKDVMDDWGAVLSIYSDLGKSGKVIARMIADVLNGKEIKDIMPQWADYGIAIDLKRADKFGITVPPGLLRQAGENVIPQGQ
jgi:putative ABC transport system substrate-binding protein